MWSLLASWEAVATQSLSGSISWQHEDRNNGGAVTSPGGIKSVRDTASVLLPALQNFYM